MKNFNKKINRRLTDSVKWKQQKYSDSLPFWVADSDYPTAKCIMKDLKKLTSYGTFGYPGDDDYLKEIITNWYLTRYQSKIEKEYISLSQGVIVSIASIIKAITNEGDGIIVQTPVYNGFYRAINNTKRKIIENKLIKKIDEENHLLTYEMDLDNLEQLFIEGHKTMILCSPHNPIGRVWSEIEMTKLFQLVKRYEINLIIDEIHSDFVFSDQNYISAAHYLDRYDKIFICNAPSKTFNIAGIQISYVIIKNEELRNKYNETYESNCPQEPNIFARTALQSAYTKCFKYVKEQNEHLYNNYQILYQTIRQYLPNAYISKLEGTYLVWIDLSCLNKTSEQLFNFFEEHHLTFSKGSNYTLNEEPYIRFNIACPRKQLISGLNIMIESLKELNNETR